MSRPLLSSDIAKLERLYLAGERDTTRLRQLEHELGFRKTARADALAQKVQAALRRCTSGELLPAETPPPTEPTEMEPNRTALPSPAPPPGPTPPPSASPPNEPPKKRAASDLPSKESKEIVEAYAALKLAPGVAWELIEASRRAIVAQARPAMVASLPPERADDLRLDASNANRAAALLRASAQRR